MTPGLIDQVCKYYGTESQIIKAIEELSELQKELCKYLLNTKTYFDKSKIVDEVADVENMTDQLRHIFGISEQVEARKEYKINRLKERINQ